MGGVVARYRWRTFRLTFRRVGVGRTCCVVRGACCGQPGGIGGGWVAQVSRLRVLAASRRQAVVGHPAGRDARGTRRRDACATLRGLLWIGRGADGMLCG